MISDQKARKWPLGEVKHYNGPIHYISHHEILNSKSISTPCRVVFNTSSDFHGYVLNNMWAKGPDFINNLLGVLIRFREDLVAFTGDIKRMYHSIYIYLN